MENMSRGKRIPAVAYMRTSTTTNAGADKDSEKRQRAAIEAYAKSAGYAIAPEDWFYDVTSGEVDIEERPAFREMMQRLLGNGARVVLVETANRFARDLMVQEVGFRMLQNAGITLIAADKPDAFLDDTPTAVLIRQVLGAVSQFEKAMLVSKLRAARLRKAARGEKASGRYTYRQRDEAMVELAKQLRAQMYRGYPMSLRDIAAELAAAGYFSATGQPFHATAVKRMLTQ